MGQLTYEKLEQNLMELQNRSVSGILPQDAEEWNKLLRNRILDNLPAGIAILDTDFRLRDCNRTYQHFIDIYSPLSPERARGECIFDYLPGLQNTASASLTETMNSSTTKIDIDREIVINSKNGAVKTFWDANLITLLKKNGMVAGIVLFGLDVTYRRHALESLKWQQKTIEDLKTTIRSLIDLRIEDKKRMEDNLYFNISQFILPLLERLKKCSLNSDQKSLVDMIESKMTEITSGFSKQLNSPIFSLTPKEVFIAGMIKQGKSTKEMADILCVSNNTVDFHRNNIRKKIGINNSSINLRSYLLSL